MTDTIKGREVVKCASVSGWSFSLFGNPKLTIQCGSCGNVFSTRNYVHVTNRNNRIVAMCYGCGKWNDTGLIYD